MTAPTTQFDATSHQIAYIEALLTKKDVDADYLNGAKELLDRGLTKREASNWIRALLEKADAIPGDAPIDVKKVRVVYKEFPDSSEPTHPDDQTPHAQRKGYLTGPSLTKNILQGYYALDTSVEHILGTSRNDMTFYRLWIGSRGGWKLYLCHGPDETEISKSLAIKVLEKISDDPMAASQLYGRTIGRCGVCGLRLTNDESRERGIGPICYSRL